MSTLIAIQDASAPEVAPFTQLTDVQLRQEREYAEGVFIAEGEKVIRRALDAGFQVLGVLGLARWVESLAPDLEPSVPCFTAPAEVLREVTGYAVHRGALALFARPPLPTLAEVCRPARTLAVLEGLVDHTNVGLVFRSAAALGIDGVVLDPRCADPLYRRAIKTSMGAVLTVPWTRAEHWPAGLAALQEFGFQILALSPSGSVDLDRLSGKERRALVLGTEGAGVSAEVLEMADAAVRIPMTGDVDSLNVAAAAAVAFWALGHPRTT